MSKQAYQLIHMQECINILKYILKYIFKLEYILKYQIYFF